MFLQFDIMHYRNIYPKCPPSLPPTVSFILSTIMDSDYILVMDDGKAKEFDTPQKLISKGGMFRDLVKASSHRS